MAGRAADDRVSLAQVEDELRAAEAYLHHYNMSSAPPGGSSPPAEEQDATHWQQQSDAAVSHMRTPLDGKNGAHRLAVCCVVRHSVCWLLI